MNTAGNEIWVYFGGDLQRLDLDEATQLLPSFQANDRTKPDTIQSDYSPEFDVPGTSHNHRLLSQAAASQPAAGSAYVRMMGVLTSGGVETLPLALLYIKGYQEGRYHLQLAGGNRRFVEALGEKTLADLDLSRFDHSWLPSTVLTGLPYQWWLDNGWGYEIFERGKPLNFQSIDPFTCYPSVANRLIFEQIITDAGFTADSLATEPLYEALNVPTANPYTYSQDFRDARALQAGLLVPYPSGSLPLEKTNEFPPDKLNFEYTTLAPYHAPTQGATYVNGSYRIDTLGYYDILGEVLLNYGCDDRRPGKVSCKVMIYVNGANVNEDAHPRVGDYVEETFTPSLRHYLLHPNDEVTLWWQGDEWPTNGFGPYDERWRVALLSSDRIADIGRPGWRLYTKATLTVTLLEEFPQGGLIKLNQWLPDMKQLDYFKTNMLLLGLTVQSDPYRPHLRLDPGDRMLANASKAPDWTAKRDAWAQPGALPERQLEYRFGDYAQRNTLEWEEDENVTPGYGNGTVLIADEVLDTAEYNMAKLPFAASETSPAVAGLLRILNYQSNDITANPPVYNNVTTKPRLTLRGATPTISGQLITAQNQTQPFTSSVSYFASPTLSLLLNATVLTKYWADLRAMLDQTRYLTERYRLTPQDIAELDFSVPIWDAILGDYFAVSQIGEFDARRPTEVKLVRLNATHLPPPVIPALGREFYLGEFYNLEHY